MSPSRLAPRAPALAVDVSADGIRLPIARARIAEIARGVLHGEGVRDALLSIAFVSRTRIAAMNRKHLGHRGATDVISFGFHRVGKESPVVGDVYICPEVARVRAREHRVGVREELTRLVVHGVLHVLGHDHPEADGRESSPMWEKQEGIVRRLLTPPRRSGKRRAR
jgi:probable rRNA maturation factor